MAKRRQYGSGSVYQVGKYWHIRYCDGNGNRQAESSKSTSKKAADLLLRKRLSESTRQTKPGNQTIQDCFNLLIEDYKMHDRADLYIVKYRMGSHLQALTGLGASAFTAKDAEAYISSRRASGAAAATINRETSILRSSLKLAFNNGWISAKPSIPHLKESNVRTGFVSAERIAEMISVLPDYLGPMVRIASLTGLRRGSLLKIRLDQVDLADGIISLHGKQVKNRIGHHVPIFDGDMRLICESAVKNNKTYLFEREGKQIRSFRRAWENACEKMGDAAFLFHDLRRTGVRNLIRAGVPEEIVMAISGHKTRDMLIRYNIVTVEDVKRVSGVFSVAELPQQGHNRSSQK